MMKKKLWVGLLSLMVTGYIGTILYSMHSMDIEELVLCSADQGEIRIPSHICDYYMTHYRMTKTDISALASGAGLDYVLNANMHQPDKFKTAKTFILHGLDIDGLNHYGNLETTPLHAAVIYNDPERVKFLINNGADSTIINNSMTALDLAKKLHTSNSSQDRDEIITFLSQEQQKLISKNKLLPPPG